MATLAELESALINADKAGDTDAARKLAAVISEARKDKANLIPGTHVPGTIPQAPEPGLIDKAIGAGEAALTAVTGATGGMLGGVIEGGNAAIAEALKGNLINPADLEKAYMQGVQIGTYAPRTQSGQEQAAALGEAAQNLIPLAGLAPEAATIAQAAKPAAVQAVQAVKQGGAKAAATVAQSRPVQAVREAVAPILPSSVGTPTPGTMASAGAAATDLGTLRQTRAGELPVPIKLTKGQRERTFEQQRFERETAKDGEIGAPIRQRYEEQNAQILQNFDAWLDQTGAEAPTLRAGGILVDKVIRNKAARDKTEIRHLYKKAEEAGEMETPVSLNKLVEHINEMMPEADTAKVLIATRRKLLKMGGAVEDANGDLVAQPISLKNGEKVRQTINRAVTYDAPDIRQSSIMKSLYDQETAGMGGNLYQQARRARAQYARQYENRAVVKNLLDNRKGMLDRKVAYEDIFKHSILDGSLDDVRMVRRVLQTEGDEGKQAWRELQGATVAHIKELTFGNSARDSVGNPVASAAKLDRIITTLDKDGKLDFVFGKQGAQQLRNINDIAKDVLTVPANAVNTSNTASVLLTALDTIATYGTTGVPVPAVQALKAISKNVKQRRIKKQVREALQ